MRNNNQQLLQQMHDREERMKLLGKFIKKIEGKLLDVVPSHDELRAEMKRRKDFRENSRYNVGRMLHIVDGDVDKKTRDEERNFEEISRNILRQQELLAESKSQISVLQSQVEVGPPPPHYLNSHRILRDNYPNQRNKCHNSIC